MQLFCLSVVLLQNNSRCKHWYCGLAVGLERDESPGGRLCREPLLAPILSEASGSVKWCRSTESSRYLIILVKH